jgi:hypothetical protein
MSRKVTGAAEQGAPVDPSQADSMAGLTFGPSVDPAGITAREAFIMIDWHTLG